ncbi:glycosyltransferase family 2 protein [Candidatus Daviesbacteria bacterium]|nr:glycosyltransferase family 2 protein [Candidatus Daviesbacteria bacterium]MBI2334537.1 glycosyltransferase family 2 protein [Candidatus Daviesbacteria bacterium]
MNKRVKVAVVIPAYNSENTLEWVYRNIPQKGIDEIIIVDDGSKDNTVGVIKKLGIKPIIHKQNLGYGANQKTLYTKALKSGAEYIIMLHPDGQYDPKDLPKFIDALKNGKGDLILGSRFLSRGVNETPFYKSISLKLIAFLFNFVLGLHLSEVNTGYRGYSAKLLKTIPFLKNGNGYIFDPQLIIQSVYFGFKIAEVPVSKKYNKEAISPNFSKSIEHGIENIKLLFEYILHRLGAKKADFLTP